MDYEVRMMQCEKHGMSEHYFDYKRWECENCLYEYFRENEYENIRVVGELNVNEVCL